MTPGALCPGCAKPPKPLAGFITAAGRIAPMCEGCAQRAEDSHVFARTVWRCVAAGATVPETEAAFAAKSLRMPTTDIEARNVWRELARRFEADTGIAPPEGWQPI